MNDLNNLYSPDDNSKYTIHLDLAEVLRAYTEGMVTAYNLGLMERNMRNNETKRKDGGE